MANIDDSVRTFYGNNPNVQGYEETPEWSVSIDGVKFSWTPYAPYFWPENSEDGYRMYDQMNAFMNRIDADEDGTFDVTPVGPKVFHGFESPHAALYVIQSIYDSDEDNVVFSENAPIFEPEQKGTYS